MNLRKVPPYIIQHLFAKPSWIGLSIECWYRIDLNKFILLLFEKKPSAIYFRVDFVVF